MYTFDTLLSEAYCVIDGSITEGLKSLSQGTGKPLVLLHGWGMNSAVFTEFLPYLTDEFNVIRICLPGFGQNSERLPNNYSLEQLSSMVARSIPDNSILVGWSLGGLVAQKISLDAAHKVAALVTIASTPCFAAQPGWAGIGAEVLNLFQQQLSRDYAKTLDRFLAIQAMGSATAKKDIKILRKHIHELPMPASVALASGLDLLETVDMRYEISQISRPTLRLYGRLDSIVPTSGIDAIHELQPAADSVVLSHAAHAPFISHPQQTADVLTNFIFNLPRIDRHCR